MAFSNFTLQSAQEQFGLNLTTNESLFPGVRPVDAGPLVHGMLATLGELALSVNTEKARSEWLIAPVLGELWSAPAERSACCPESILHSTKRPGSPAWSIS